MKTTNNSGIYDYNDYDDKVLKFYMNSLLSSYFEKKHFSFLSVALQLALHLEASVLNKSQGCLFKEIWYNNATLLK